MENKFFWEDYLILNPDIINQNKEKGALSHYQNHGKKENRLIKYPDLSKISFIFNFDSQKSFLKKKMLQSYGIEIVTLDLNKECTKDFFFICNKFKIISEMHKNMLFYVLNGVNYKLTSNTNKQLHLVISLYNEKDFDRVFELLIVFALNFQNNSIQKIHILFENNNSNLPNLLRTVINVIILRHKLQDKIIIFNVNEKPSFQSIFEYVNKFPTLTNVIVSNSDILFDNSLDLVNKNLKEDHFICLSRYNWEKNKKKWELIYMNFNNNKYSNVFSHDSWIFKAPMKYPLKIDINLGDMFSDSYLNYKLKVSTYYSCFNLSKSIRIFHVQEKDSFSDLVNKNPNLMNELLEKIRIKEYGNNDILFGIYYSSINEWNDANKNKFVSNLYFQQHTSEFLC
jgi:hypothetical protein